MDDPRPDIRYAPTQGLTYNPNDPRYWDEAALQQEIERTFDLCHGCRMCFKFCQSFPTLFDAVDRYGDVREIPPEVRDRVVDQCFQCKLCYTECPYTEAQGHEFRIDFPRLIQRAKAQDRRRRGVPLRDKLLADPDRLARMVRPLPQAANLMNRLRPARVVMEKVAGIHRDKLLPPFASRPFRRRVARRAASVGGGSEREVVLFPTCFVEHNRPEIGEAALFVLEHNGCRVHLPPTVCCGMPALEAGDIETARAKALRNVEVLAPHAEAGREIAVINPTCSLTLKSELPHLLDDPRNPGLAEKARRVAGAVRDVSEYLHGLRRAGAFREDFRSSPDGPVAYHAPCHLRLQAVGFRGRDLIRRIPGASPHLVAECCGHDGTWSMKREHFDAALRIGEKSFAAMDQAGAELWVTDCPLAALQFRQARGREALHPVEVLARAYREDGFPKRVAREDRPGNAPGPGEGRR